jgi:mannose-6-phosphate isomerase
VERVTGVVQHYAWGDPEAIPSILGVEADGRPWAELWLGTHRGGPSTLGDGRPLADAAGALPYLLKVLAAAEPLSLQTHPDADAAQEGFAREAEAGLDADAPDRIYRDPHPKPELIVALTPFDALCGFRPVTETVELLRAIGGAALANDLMRLGLGATVAGIYRGELDVRPTIDACAIRSEPEARLVTELDARHPDDPSVVTTLLLNRVALAPGEAVFLGPGNLHAYLSGTGVEIMGSSDNVIRGGLTAKHVDVDELLNVLDFTPLLDPVVRAAEVSPGHWCYDTPHVPFRLWRFEVDGSMTHTATGRELLLCTAGDAGALAQGEAVYLAPDEPVTLTGRATVFRVEEVD